MNLTTARAREPNCTLDEVGPLPPGFQTGMARAGMSTVVAVLTDLPTGTDDGAEYLARNTDLPVDVCRKGLAVVRTWAHDHGSELHRLSETVRCVIPGLGARHDFRETLRATAIQEPERQAFIYKLLTNIVTRFGHTASAAITGQWIAATAKIAELLKLDELPRLEDLMSPLFGAKDNIDGGLRVGAVSTIVDRVKGLELINLITGLGEISKFTKERAETSNVTTERSHPLVEWTVKFPVALYRLGLRLARRESYLSGEISTGVLCAVAELANKRVDPLLAAVTTATTVDCLKEREASLTSTANWCLAGAAVSASGGIGALIALSNEALSNGLGTFGLLVGALAFTASSSFRLLGKHFNLSVESLYKIVNETAELVAAVSLYGFRKGAAFETANLGNMARVLRHRADVLAAVRAADVTGTDPVLSDASPARVFLEGSNH